MTPFYYEVAFSRPRVRDRRAHTTHVDDDDRTIYICSDTQLRANARASKNNGNRRKRDDNKKRAGADPWIRPHVNRAYTAAAAAAFVLVVARSCLLIPRRARTTDFVSTRVVV